MIQANELMLGNWVIYENKLFPYNEPIPFQVSLSTFHDLHLMVSHKGHIAGIPITDDWLVKLGFEKNIILNPKQFQDFYYIACWNNHNEVVALDYDCYETTVIAKDIKYVHQLQNLYKLLTGQELTIKQ